MRQFQAAADKMRTWFDRHFDSQGVFALAPDNPICYFKAPYVMAYMGLRAKGACVAKYTGEQFLDANGDLTGSSDFTIQTRLYGMGWLALGASTTGRYDVAQLVAQRLVERLDPQCGAYVLPDQELEENAGDLQTSGGAGMGLVPAGRLDAAQRLAQRFASHIINQPEPRRMYRKFRRDGSVVATGRAYELDVDQQGPAGLAPLVLMLVWLGRATRDRRYFAIANEYVEFVYSSKFDPANFARSSKFGWAMVELYQDTGDRRLLERAVRMGEVLVGWQSADGMWDPRPVGPGSDTVRGRINYSEDCGMTVLSLAALPDD